MKEYTETVIYAFLTNSKVVDIAKACNLSESTIHRYQKDPELQRILSERRAETQKAVLSRMSTMLDKCLTEIEKILDNPDAADQVKINACNTLYNQYQALNKAVNLEDRLLTLESQIHD